MSTVIELHCTTTDKLSNRTGWDTSPFSSSPLISSSSLLLDTISAPSISSLFPHSRHHITGTSLPHLAVLAPFCSPLPSVLRALSPSCTRPPARSALSAATPPNGAPLSIRRVAESRADRPSLLASPDSSQQTGQQTCVNVRQCASMCANVRGCARMCGRARERERENWWICAAGEAGRCAALSLLLLLRSHAGAHSPLVRTNNWSLIVSKRGSEHRVHRSPHMFTSAVRIQWFSTSHLTLHRQTHTTISPRCNAIEEGLAGPPAAPSPPSARAGAAFVTAHYRPPPPRPPPPARARGVFDLTGTRHWGGV